MTPKQVKELEKLGMILSNFKCRIDSKENHPLLKVQENYSDLTLSDIQQMNEEDRRIVAKILNHFSIGLNPEAPDFAEKCYDALWILADQMGETAKKLEQGTYQEALDFLQ
ncbi:MAG: hypothetical protein Tsb0015_07820 [Simkaniaceae bacterium]